MTPQEAVAELYEWIEANEPELHEKLIAEPPPISNALRVLEEACGFPIPMHEAIKETTQKVIQTLTNERREIAHD